MLIVNGELADYFLSFGCLPILYLYKKYEEEKAVS